MRRKTSEIFPKLYASGIDYIDPVSCGSTAAFKIIGYTYDLDAQIDLTDCNRKITWDFSGSHEGLAKIDKTVGMLLEFRKALQKAVIEYKKDKKLSDSLKKEKETSDKTAQS